MDDIFNQAAVAEYNKALQQLSTEKTAQMALKKSFERYDNLIATSVEASTTKPACKAGCAFCCYYKVEVRAHEVFLIKDYLQKNCTHEQLQSVLSEAEKNSLVIKTLTHEQHLSTNIKCPFLNENNCSIYSARPFKCRNFHATDASACESSFNEPSNLSIENTFVETVAMFGNAHSQGFERAAQTSGLDFRAYDLNTALLEVFADPTSLKRFKRGKKAFKTAIEIIDE